MFLVQQSVFNYLGELAVLIIKFDNIFTNGQLKRLWPYYMKLVRLIEQNLDKLDTAKLRQMYPNLDEFTEDDVQGLENVLLKFEFLFTGDLFQVRSL